ncbi:39S ribosomal protein L18, mitochondrial [Anopheles nili]|uniref:39S ribosomal protein L18, mitochondrial n=1 Tax=Anopheles nili TaxID=185578 RepID=UPI00237B4E54|nr:39S ribosomal protein L18, mitochondrial [Anopheles nili]
MKASSKQVLCKIQQTSRICNDVLYMVNRNPRNLEQLRLAYKTDGYHLEKPVRNFWHKLELVTSKKYITAKLIHFENGTIIECSTTEWALKRHLYKGNDFTAHTTLGKAFAARCLEAGLTEMRCDLQPADGGKVAAFLNSLQECGISLKEPSRIRTPYPWDMHRPEKPWELTE